MTLKIGITCYPTYGGSGVIATELGKELARQLGVACLPHVDVAGPRDGRFKLGIAGGSNHEAVVRVCVIGERAIIVTGVNGIEELPGSLCIGAGIHRRLS